MLKKTMQKLAEHRRNRRAYWELERQLATYRSPSERAEIEAIIARADGDTTHIERILTRQARQRVYDQTILALNPMR